MAGSFAYEDFLESFKRHIKEQTAETREVSRIAYGPGRSVRLCPEPVTFLSQLDEGNQARSKADSQAAFESLAKTFKQISLENGPKSALPWFNSTKRGINLRPGLDAAGTGKIRAKILGDESAHALMVGQTGSGKSVLLNNLIFNMLAEYPPWELDLYLADFKRVEFSRYMNESKTPHVCACAATGEVRYVLSLISYLVECMNAREELFSRLGLTKLEAFRDKYPDLVLPRMLLIVDEFQQLFLEASPREGDKVRRLLTAIVKKGRATGLHLLFSSQEMGQTLSRSSLVNFRLRFALSCSASVSMDVLGNPGASRIPRGTVLVNASDGTEEKNEEFLVPHIETEEKAGKPSAFYDYLRDMAERAESMGFCKNQKFYKEEFQEPFSCLEGVLERIRDERKKILNTDRYFDVLTLGSYVTFSNLRYDIQTLFLENGRNKNILAVSPRVEDLAYLEKLFSANFATSPKHEVTGVSYRHEIYSFQPGVRNLFPLEKATGQTNSHTNPEDLDALEPRFARQRMLLPLFQQCRTPYEFALKNYQANLSAMRRSYSAQEAARMEEEAKPTLQKLFGHLDMEGIPAAAEKIQSGDYPETGKIIARNLMDFYRCQKNPYEVFPPTVYWLIGVDSLERIPEWLMAALKNGMDYNSLFIMMANSEFDQITQLAKYCDYIFAGGGNSRIYDRLHMNYTFREADSIVLDLYIKSTEEDRSFKKYECSFGRVKSPSIPFDEILPPQ